MSYEYHDLTYPDTAKEFAEAIVDIVGNVQLKLDTTNKREMDIGLSLSMLEQLAETYLELKKKVHFNEIQV